MKLTLWNYFWSLSVYIPVIVIVSRIYRKKAQRIAIMDKFFICISSLYNIILIYISQFKYSTKPFINVAALYFEDPDLVFDQHSKGFRAVFTSAQDKKCRL